MFWLTDVCLKLGHPLFTHETRIKFGALLHLFPGTNPKYPENSWLHMVTLYIYVSSPMTYRFFYPHSIFSNHGHNSFFSSQRNLHLRRGRTWTSARNPTGMTKPCLWQRTRLRIGTRKAPPCASRKRPGDKATFGGNGVATVNFEWENLGLLCDVVCVFFSGVEVLIVGTCRTGTPFCCLVLPGRIDVFVLWGWVITVITVMALPLIKRNKHPLTSYFMVPFGHHNFDEISNLVKNNAIQTHAEKHRLLHEPQG